MTSSWITVFHDEVTRPDGASGVYGVVHPAASACGIVVLDEHDRTLLVGQHRYTLDEYSWEIPEGGVDAADPLAGAQRELREETGVAAAQWHELGRFTLSNSVSDERGVMYLATGITFGTAEPEGTEVLEVRWVPFADALGMVLDGRITDLYAGYHLRAHGVEPPAELIDELRTLEEEVQRAAS